MDLRRSMSEEPAAAGRGAQLLLALILAAVLPVFLLTLPIPTHSMKIDLPHLPEAIVPSVPAAASGPPVYLLTSMALPDLDLEPARALHELVVTPQDEVLWNGKEVDVAGLWARLNIVGTREEWVDFRPDPNARYEAFAEVLAVTKRARLERMRLDSRPFRSAIDDRPEPLGIRRRR